MKQIASVLKANSFEDLLSMMVVTVVILLLIAAARPVATRIVRRLSGRMKGRVDDAVAESIGSTSLIVLSPLALYAGTSLLELPERWDRVLANAAVVALLVQVGLWASRFVVAMQSIREQAKRTEDPAGATAVNLIGFGARILIWALVVLLSLDRLGINITALVAGLGIGGVAVALAVQNILGDLFASLSIVLDKPFVVGDFIVVDEFMGNVEHVGIKTTRLRSLGGELLIMSNADLLRSRVRNYRRMRERRIAFTVGVVYQTPEDKLRAIPGLLREAVETQEGTRFDRAHFKDFGDSSLNFETVYYVLSPDYLHYMDAQQAINFSILRSFAALDIGFAYPTRTLIFEQSTPTGREPGAVPPMETTKSP